MTIRRWVQLASFLLVLFVTRHAGAVVIGVCDQTNCTGSKTAAVGNVVVASTGSNTNLYLTTDTNNSAVDLVTSGCTGTGTGTFSVKIGNATTNISLNTGNPSTNNAITVQYKPMTRGGQSCTVNVYANGTTTPSLASFTISATGIAPAINSPAPLAFGNVRYQDATPLAAHSVNINLVVQNTSTDTGQDLVISSLTSANTTDYTITAPASSTIAPNSSATWVVNFNPVTAGNKDTTITIMSNDPINPSRTVTVTGYGGDATIGVTTSINFGIVPQNTTSATQPITVSNTSSATTRAAMGVTQAAFVNNGAGWFKFKQTGCVDTTVPCVLGTPYSLTSNTGTFTVECNPPSNASGMQTASVVVTSDADDTTANTTSLSCTAGRADIVVTTTPLAFGNQLINTSSAVQTVAVQNTGNTTLNYTVTLAGVDPTQFDNTGIPASCTKNASPSTPPYVYSCTLSATTTVNIPVYFSPTALGDKSAVLRVSPTNDPDTAGPIDVGLSGTCIGPVASYNVTSMAFGDVEIGQTATPQTLTVSNTGSANLSVTVAYLQAGATQYVVPTGTTGNPLSPAISVAPNGSTSWTIACKPTAQGTDNGTFQVTTNTATGSTTQNIALTCNGTQGHLVFSPSLTTTLSFDFGQKIEGTMTSQTFTIKNDGNLPVTNITVTPTGTGTGYSILSPTFPITSLAANTTVVITVQFYPIDGTYGGTYNYTFGGKWGANNSSSNNAVLTLNGDGLSSGYDTNPSNPYPLDFGDIRWDTPTTDPLAVINTAGAAYNVLSLTITPDANTASSELTIVNCVKGNASSITKAVAATANGCPSAGNPYASPATVNDTMTVFIKCAPNNRVGMIGGTILIHSDLPIAAKQDKIVSLKCNSTTAVLDLAPGNVVDFGPIDLDVTPTATTKTVTLRNTGVAAMNINTVTRPGAGPFVLTATPSNVVVAPNATYSFDVTYTPSGERLASQPDTASIILPLSGAIGTPGSLTVTMSGYGVDRHIALGPVPVFPNTFKNPGDKAPVLPVTVTNNGDANLNVSAVMLSDYPIWSIVNPDPTDVGGRQSYDFNVKFEPVSAGKAPTGHMVIMNNDNGKPMVTIDLDGNGLDRQVAFGPPEINMGYVGIGIETRLSTTGGADPSNLLLDVTNNEASDTFMITRIGVDGGDGAFQVVDKNSDTAPTNTELAPQSTQQFDVVFTPNHEGDFVADANLYLDNADQPHATVRLRGRGLYVDVKGGGGCSATGNGSGGAMLLVLGALLVGRRRRKRAALGAALGVVGMSAIAQADTRNLDTALFDPTPATHVNTLQSQSADVGDDGEYAVSALLTYADNPLVLKTSQNTYTPVDNRAMLVLGGAYAFGKRFEAGLRMPLYFQSGQATAMQTDQFQVSQIDSVSRGDATVHIKMNGGAAEALGGDLSYGGAFSLSIPTRSSSEFAGTNMPQARVLGLATLTEGRLVIQANAGGIIRSKERYSSLVQRSGLTFAVGGNYRTTDNLWLGAEVFGNVIPGGKTGDPAPMEAYGPSMTETSIEALGEATYRMSRTATLGFALGRGINSGVGTSNVRGALVFAYTPGATELAPLPKHVHVEGPNDKDGDGIKDKLDACPNEPEDKDMFEDGDGCPDVDNDNDGIADDKDKCPLDPEDKDRFQDDDGCPDKDNDGDGIADDQDKCPLAAEDKDGFQDTDGCPEPDNDNDGIVDKADKCPNEPETINGNNDDDGCPDKGDALVVMSPDRLDLLDNITFESGGSKISRASKNILGQIGATLRAHPELVRIRLTAHVQPTSNPQKDQALSEARAKAVQQWLVDWGIDPLRLQSSGFGGTKPLVDPKGRGAQAINDRFELIILERK